MNIYRVIGTSRQWRAIGLPEAFEKTLEADSSRKAYEIARADLYARSQEHVQVTEIAVKDTRNHQTTWIAIDPDEYL